MYVQPRVVGYASFQATTRTTVVLPAGRHQRCLSTSSIGVPNPGASSTSWPGGFSSSANHQNPRNVQNPLSNENVPFIPPHTIRHVSEAVPAPNPAPSTSWNWSGGTSRGESSNHHQNACNVQNFLPHENIPFIPPHSIRIQDPALHVRHQRQSEKGVLSVSTQPSHTHPQQLAVLPHTYTRERRPSHVPRPLHYQRRQYSKADFFRGQFVNFDKYKSSARIAAHFVSDRFPVIERNQIRPFVYHLLCMTCDRPNIMYGALLLLQRLKVIKPRWKPDEVSNFPCYVFMCAYMVARKFILDDSVQNKALLCAMSLPIDLLTLNYLERSFMKGLDYNLIIDSALLSDFSKKVKNDFLLSCGRYPTYPWDVVSKTDPRADRFCV